MSSTEELTLTVKKKSNGRTFQVKLIAREVNGCVIYRPGEKSSKTLYWSLSDFAMKEKVTILKVDDT